VLLLDQDSVPLAGMTQALLDGLHALERKGVRVACVGPRLKLVGCDHASPFRRLGWLGPRIDRGAAPGAPAECDYLIASGTLVPVAVLDEVGGMEEALFIDQVDTEWCCRARALGYRVFGVPDAMLDHRVGEGVRWIWLGRWRRLFAQKPVRYYYIFRNTLVLMRRGYVGAKFVPFHLAWLAAMLAVFGIFGRRPEALGMMLKGIAHGALGRSGELPAQSEAPTPATRSVAPNRQDSGRG
jgi:rhamnosyltransferase